MTIIYRACSVGNPQKARPIKNKEELIEKCFGSFLKAFEGIDYDLTILIDKPTPRLRNLFKDFKTEETYYSSFNEGNIKSFHRQIDLALQGRERYFLIEDDYFFLPNAGEVISDIDHDFFTPYDHPDYYFDIRHTENREIRFSGGHHWQAVKATTLTFGGVNRILELEADNIKKFGWADYPMWLDLTKRWKLWSPIPTLATHLETEFLSPGVEWNFA